MACTEHLTVGGSRMEMYVAGPAGAGPHPGVVVTHHRGALDGFTQKFVQDFATAGQVAATLRERLPLARERGRPA